jgi:release factor glutamine methyltransferase
VNAKFDIILSNPPYISEKEFENLSYEIRKFEPKTALVCGREGTEFHRDIAEKGLDFLERGGWLAMEIGAGHRKAIEKILEETKSYCNIAFHFDYAGIERVVTAQKR